MLFSNDGQDVVTPHGGEVNREDRTLRIRREIKDEKPSTYGGGTVTCRRRAVGAGWGSIDRGGQ